MNVDSKNVDPENQPEHEECSFGLAGMASAGEAYNEQAFHYFLDIERMRSERCGRPMLLLLAELKGLSGQRAPIEPPLAGRLFSALSSCLRETDFIGWYREDRVAGAVLTQQAPIADADISQKICGRLKKVIANHLEPDLSNRLRFRVFQIPSRPEGDRS